MSLESWFWALEDAGGSWLGFSILILIWIWSLVFDIPMIRSLALYLDFEGAKNIQSRSLCLRSLGHILSSSLTDWHVDRNVDIGWLILSKTLSLLNPDPDVTDPTWLGLTYLNWSETYWGLISELSLIWAWYKLQRRSKQGFWPYPNQDQVAKPQSRTSSPHQSPQSGLKRH